MTRKTTLHVLITLFAVLMYVPFLGSFHLFDWDEINFAEAAREMIVTHDYSRVQIGFSPFWEKPPLFIWLQVLSMKIFGVTEFAARFPNALCGIFTLNILYHFGRKIQGHFSGIFWVLAYAGSLAPALYFKSGIIDPVFNLFIILSIHQLFRAELGKTEFEAPRIHYLLAGLFAGLAVLTKGPVGLLIIILVGIVRLIINPKFAWPGIFNLGLMLITCIGISSLWILPEWINHGNRLFIDFWNYQTQLAQGTIDWHTQPWFYHIIVLLFLCFPASVFALPHLFRNTSFSGTEKLYGSYMRATFWVVLILFSIIGTKIIHYSSLCWIPLAWFAGNTMYRKHTNRGNIPGWVFIPFFLVLFILGLVITSIPLALGRQWPFANLSDRIPDVFAKAILHQPSGWLGFEWAIGLAFLISGLIWFSQYVTKPKSNAIGIFICTAALSALIWIGILPNVEKQLQGKYIESLKELKDDNRLVESWGFKTYAIYFYSNAKPSEFKGPWEKELSKYTKYNSPSYQARLEWMMDHVINRPVFIYTRNDYKPDEYFSDKFKLIKPAGAYLIWERKDPAKPDMRYNY